MTFVERLDGHGRRAPPATFDRLRTPRRIRVDVAPAHAVNVAPARAANAAVGVA